MPGVYARPRLQLIRVRLIGHMGLGFRVGHVTDKASNNVKFKKGASQTNQKRADQNGIR